MKKKPTLKKPILSKSDVLKFAEGPPDAPQGDEIKKAGQGKGGAEKSPPAGPQKGAGNVPAGDVRLTANINQDLHLKLKIAAARQRTTIGELIERLIEANL